MRRLAVVAALAACGCGHESDGQPALSWISPDPDVRIEVGDPVELTVESSHAGTGSVAFEVNGVEIGVCGAGCRIGDTWRWSTAFPRAGEQRLVASLRDADGIVVRIEQTVKVFAPVRSAADAGAADRRATPDAAAPPPPSGNRGFLDPDLPYHNIFDGMSWAVQSQTVQPQTGPLVGSVAGAATCMNRFGPSIRKWADHHGVSRASVVATAITESNCTNPSGSSDGLSSGPMQVTGSTCQSVTGVPSATCKAQMHADPDFSFEVGVRYIAGSYQTRQHQHDPPKIAAAYNAGSLRATAANRWHLVTTGNHIDRFVSAYNAYRAWENGPGVALTLEQAIELVFEGEHVDRAESLPPTAREGQSVFVGDWGRRDGQFHVFMGGRWRAWQ